MKTNSQKILNRVIKKDTTLSLPISNGMQKDFDEWNKRTAAALADGGCRGDVCNNGRRTTVYLHARNRFSQTIISNTTTHLLRMITLPTRESSKTVDKRKRGDSSRTGTMKL